VVNSALVVGGFGIFATAVGALGLAGKLIRLPSTTLTGNYAAHLLLGLAMLAAVPVDILGGDSPLGSLLSVPALVLLCTGLYAFFRRPPRWIVPQWQREMDREAKTAERRPRR
jgi:hypothetical protein